MISLEPQTVADALAVDGYSIVPLTSEQRMKARMEIRAASRSITSEDSGSLALRSRLHSVREILSPDAHLRLTSLPLLWVDSSLPHAAAIEVNGAPAIIVCRGLFDLVHFQTSLHNLCTLLKKTEQPPEIDHQNELPQSQLMSLAGHVILADAYSQVRPPATVSDMLGRKVIQNIELGVATSLLLLVLHEVGHVELGHTQRSLINKDVEVRAVSNAIQSATREQLEFDADAYSLDCIRKEWQPSLLASLIDLHNVFHFVEIFGVRPSNEYPSTENRLSTMINRIPLLEEDRQFAQSWLEDYRLRQRTIAAGTSSPSEMVERFDSTMTIDKAYRVVQDIRSKLNATVGILDIQ